MAEKTWRVSCISHGSSGDEEITTFHALDNSAIAVPNLNAADMASAVYSWIGSEFQNLVGTDGVFDRILVTEDVTYWVPGVIGEAGEHDVSTAGSYGPGDGKLPREACLWASAKTDVPKRYARGGFHTPSPKHGGIMTSSGLISSTTAFWTASQALVAKLLAGHDRGVGGIDGHISMVVYSVTQRRRGASNYFFDVKTLTLDNRLHWLRTRTSIP